MHALSKNHHYLILNNITSGFYFIMFYRYRAQRGKTPIVYKYKMFRIPGKQPSFSVQCKRQQKLHWISHLHHRALIRRALEWLQRSTQASANTAFSWNVCDDHGSATDAYIPWCQHSPGAVCCPNTHIYGWELWTAACGVVQLYWRCK